MLPEYAKFDVLSAHAFIIAPLFQDEDCRMIRRLLERTDADDSLYVFRRQKFANDDGLRCGQTLDCAVNLCYAS